VLEKMPPTRTRQASYYSVVYIVVAVFILSIGFYITPALLGGGRVLMIAVLIEKQVREFLDWGFAAALSMVLLGAALLVYAAFRKLMKSDLQWS